MDKANGTAKWQKEEHSRSLNQGVFLLSAYCEINNDSTQKICYTYNGDRGISLDIL